MTDSQADVVIATEADLVHIVQLVNDAYRGTSKAPGWTNERALLAGQRTDTRSLRAMVERDGATILVAKDHGRVVGCVALQPLKDGTWYLSMLAVDPDYQARGVGKTLMAGAEYFANAHGAQAIRISVIKQRESLIAWYERRGYLRTGAVDPFPYDDPTVGTPLQDDLELVTLTKPLQPPTGE